MSWYKFHVFYKQSFKIELLFNPIPFPILPPAPSNCPVMLRHKYTVTRTPAVFSSPVYDYNHLHPVSKFTLAKRGNQACMHVLG